MGQTQTYIGELVVKTCPVCAITYGLDSAFNRMNNERSRSWYCPNGHSLSFVEPELEKAKKRAARAEQDAAYWRDRMREEQEEAQAARNRERAQKAAKTRLKNRIKNGVCPCCKRHFKNVEAHIKGQHPGYAAVPDTGKDG